MLRFYFGVMGSSKTAMLLMQRHNYIQQGYNCALIKPSVDTRKGADIVYSRVGLQAHADIVLEPDHSVREQLLWFETRKPGGTLQHVFVDEAQFLTEAQVIELAEMAGSLEIHCYGLKNRLSRPHFFPRFQRIAALCGVLSGAGPKPMLVRREGDDEHARGPGGQRAQRGRAGAH